MPEKITLGIKVITIELDIARYALSTALAIARLCA
jgi:hypothetical protein